MPRLNSSGSSRKELSAGSVRSFHHLCGVVSGNIIIRSVNILRFQTGNALTVNYKAVIVFVYLRLIVCSAGSRAAKLGQPASH